MPENSYTHFFQFAPKIERAQVELFVLVVYINLLGKAKVLQYLKLAKVSYAGSVHAIMVQEEPILLPSAYTYFKQYLSSLFSIEYHYFTGPPKEFQWWFLE